MDMRAEKRALDKIYKRRDRYEIPDWHRKWSQTSDIRRPFVYPYTKY